MAYNGIGFGLGFSVNMDPVKTMIPGSVGAAPIQNIGAYGLEVGERFHSLTAWDFEKRAFFSVDRNRRS